MEHYAYMRSDNILQVWTVGELTPEMSASLPSDITLRKLTAAEHAIVRSAAKPGIDSNGNVVDLAPPPTLAQLQKSKNDELRKTVNRFIEQKPDGSVRYDVNLKLNMIVYGLDKSPASEAYAWVKRVQQEYETISQQVFSATSSDALDAIDISYDNFESSFGVNGSVLADPNIYTKDL